MKEVLIACHKRMEPYIHRTPVLTSSSIDSMVGAELYFKCENFQRMGAFKMRGAINAMLEMDEEQRSKGVLTHSSGNFAQAVSLAANSLGVPAYIVMPDNASTVKVDAVKGYGGSITFSDSTQSARERAATVLAERTGATFIHPSNDMQVIIGNATAAMELLQEHPDLDMIYAPVGGGGLVAGTALAAHHLSRRSKVRGAEPATVDDAYRSMISGNIEQNTSSDTIADGLRTTLGDINFPMIQEHVESITLVSEEEIITAMQLVWSRMKMIIEPSSAVALAAILKDRKGLKNQKIGLIVSGGNVDLKELPF